MRLRVAIVGYGNLGAACVHALREAGDLELAGVVRRSPGKLPAPFAAVDVVTHVRDLGRIDAVLLCVPATETTAAARDILQLHLPLAECAILDGAAARAHYESIAAAARNHRVAAVVAAGWEPGLFDLLQRAFELLIPRGATTLSTRPGVSLHHTEAVRNIDGVADALTTETRDADGRPTRYVYAELAKGASAARVQAALDADPLFAGARTLLFPVASVSRLEHAAHGVVFERHGAEGAGAHQNILFEARFDTARFAAQVMLDAARRLPQLKPGMHPYALWAAGPM